MARFNFNISEGSFEVIRVNQLDTDCASIFTYEIRTEIGNTVTFRTEDPNSYAENGKYFINGNEAPFDGSLRTIVYSAPITVVFSIQNSGVSGAFNSVDFVVNDNTTNDPYNSYTNTATRLDDGERCNDATPGFVTTYDQLTDTPNTKVGEAGKIIIVSQDGTKHEYIDPNSIIAPPAFPVENEYPDIASMLADQANQTEKFFQFVVDASADPEVQIGDSAYYEKLSTSTGSLTGDYRLLSDGETLIIEDANGYKVFRVDLLQDNSVPITTIRGGRIGFEYDILDDFVTGVFFNRRYSDIIENIVAENGRSDFFIRIYNRRARKYHLIKVDSFDYVNTDFVRANVEKIVNISNFQINDRVVVDWDIDTAGGGATLEKEVTQVAHGLVSGSPVRLDGSNFILALADTSENAVAIGIVTDVPDADNFTYQTGGWTNINLGLSNGDEAFLQDDGSIGTTPGTINLFLGTQTPNGFLIEIGQGFEEGDGGGSLPNGGLINDELIKQSATDGDAEWYRKAYFNVKLYGAKGDGIQLTDGAISSGDATFTSASATFTANDVGKVMHIEGAGASGGYLTTTIATFTSGTEVELTDNASTTVSGAVSLYGTDDTTFIQAAINAADENLGGTVFIPNGNYIINGALQNGIGVDNIDYNSQLYIPRRERGFIDEFSTIWIEGETTPMLGQSGGLSVSLPQLAGVTLISTIQGSGVDPSVICTRNDADTPLNVRGFFNYQSLGIRNLNILVTANENNKVTMGGISAFASIVAYFEYITIFPYNLGLFDTQEPDVIEVTGLSVPAINCTPGGYVNQVSVGGFTNGYKFGEHVTFTYANARCCTNALVATGGSQSTVFVEFLSNWCKNGISVDLVTGVLAYIKMLSFKSEVYQSGKWYDHQYSINDPSNNILGKLEYNVVRANIGVDNDFFIINGGDNITCRPYSVEKTRSITSGETLTLSALNSLRTSYNSIADAAINLPQLSTNASNPFTPERMQSTYYAVRNIGNLIFTPASGVTIETIPSNYRTTNGNKSLVKLTYLGSNIYRLDGDLQETAGGIITPNVIRYLKFNNNVEDATLNSTPIATSIIYDATGKVNESAIFVGGANYVVLPNASDLSFGDGTTDSPFSVDFWVNFDTVASTQRLFVKRDGGTTGGEEYRIIWSSSNKLVFTLYDDSTGGTIAISGSTTPTISTWYHVAFTYDGSSTEAGLKMYVDGVEETYTSQSSGSYTAMEVGTINPVIGTQPWALGSSSFDGQMDEFRVWDKELSSVEVNDLVADGDAGIELP